MAPLSSRTLALHAAACQRNESGYIDPDSGLLVMTSFGLMARGYCCGIGCRHCPWPPQAQEQAGRPANTPAWPWPGNR